MNRRIASVLAQEDDIVYGKVGCSAAAFKTAMTGRTVLDARQQGKYFWLVMDKAPHPVMHLGMTGWIKFSNDDTGVYRENGKEKKVDDEWPPKYWKWVLKTDGDEGGEVAFVDPRRLARIRLVDAPGEELRKNSPLKENGPDPVVDKDILTVEWLEKKLKSKKVPVKALLLDQANISGVGNWVADEVLYQAKIHPEQYSNTFNDEQIKQLHDSLIYVCTTAVELLAESDKFPEHWLMKYRWDKGKKGEVNKLPNGEKIVHLKVGGRTSAIVPTVQKKTGAVAGDVSEGVAEDGGEGEEETKPAKKGRGTKRKAAENEENVEEPAAAKGKGRGQRKVKAEDADEEDGDMDADAGAESVVKEEKAPKSESNGRRRSARKSGN